MVNIFLLYYLLVLTITFCDKKHDFLLIYFMILINHILIEYQSKLNIEEK